MKKNGFTLIELLGVIILLALLMIIVFPSIINSVKNSSEKTDNLTLELIYNASDLYISDHIDDFPKKSQYKYIIGLRELVDEGLLVSPITLSDNDNDITDNKCIQVTYDDGYKYELKDIGTCEETKIYYENGDTVYFDVSNGISCKEEDYTESQSATGVKEGCMKFYAFNDSKSSDTVNLLLDHNTTALVAWNSSGSNVNGPGELLEQLQSDTGSWEGTETPTNYSLDQSSAPSGAKYTIDYSEYEARLISAEEVAQITGNLSWNVLTATSEFYFDSNTTTANSTCTSEDTSGCSYGWLYDRTSTSCKSYGCSNNSETDVYGYWTSSSYALELNKSWSVERDGILIYDIVDSDIGGGVRPVIEVLKSNLS